MHKKVNNDRIAKHFPQCKNMLITRETRPNQNTYSTLLAAERQYPDPGCLAVSESVGGLTPLRGEAVS